jgi:hypothetical protein
VDSFLSHVDARWQLVPIEFHCRGSIHVEQFKCHPRSPLSSVPDGNQYCNDDSSGGMRKSGYDVDDAGDASNTEIGVLTSLRCLFARTPQRWDD